MSNLYVQEYIVSPIHLTLLVATLGVVFALFLEVIVLTFASTAAFVSRRNAFLRGLGDLGGEAFYFLTGKCRSRKPKK